MSSLKEALIGQREDKNLEKVFVSYSATLKSP